MAVWSIPKDTVRKYFSTCFPAKAVAFYTLTPIVSIAILVWVEKLFSADLSIPFVYYRDGLFTGSTIKGMIDNSWFLHNSLLGAPGVQSLLDYPTADNFHFLLIKFLTLFSSNWALVMNLFYIATFPLTAMSTLFVFRRLSVSFPLAAVGGLLFTFAPYHLWQGEEHLTLSAIYVIPLTGLMVLRICCGRTPLTKVSPDSRESFDLWSPRALGYVLIALVTASSGLYYAFFACFFLVVAGVYGAFTNRSLMRLGVAAALLLIVVAGLIANMSPSLIYVHDHGRNQAVASRTWLETEVYSTSIANLVLPVMNHRVAYMRDLTAKFLRGIDNEKNWSALGSVGTAGFLLLLAWLMLAKGGFSRSPGDRKRQFKTLDALSVLSLAALLLAVYDGFGTLFSILFTAEIRAYNRISIYLSFFAVLAVMLVLELLWRKYVTSTGIRLLSGLAVLAAILVLGVLDQTNISMVPSYSVNATAFTVDADYVQRIEERLPADSMVFELPYTPFPESPPVNNMQDYEELIPYLHSGKLRWSYGAMKGRDKDGWQKAVAQYPVDGMLRELVQAGFSGLYINGKGYNDGGAGIVKQLGDALHEKPLVSESGYLFFFDIRNQADNTGGAVN